MRGTKLTVSIKAVAFAIKGDVPEDVKLERLRLFLEQEATRKGASAWTLTNRFFRAL